MELKPIERAAVENNVVESEADEQAVTELNALQLALVGGGAANVVFV